MHWRPLVSIVIPVFNGARYLGEAIDSALAQTWDRTEVIVVDDGSTDGGATRIAAQRFGDAVRYIRQQNGGVASALNTGIGAMRGELFSWLSHDDVYKPLKLERQVEAWRQFGRTCVVTGDWEYMSPSGITFQAVSAAGQNLVARPLDAVFGALINGCALLVPRELFDRVGMFETGLPTTQDYELWYRMASVVPFVHCPYADVRQRVHEEQGSRAASHVAEASRMFINLVDRTPPETMRAYEGSELRFLARIRRLRTTYPGFSAYLDFRMDLLFSRFAYVVALPPGADAGAVRERMSRTAKPPVAVLAADHPLLSETRADAVVFAGAATLPEADELAEALREFAVGDAEAMKVDGATLVRAGLRPEDAQAVAEWRRGDRASLVSRLRGKSPANLARIGVAVLGSAARTAIARVRSLARRDRVAEALGGRRLLAFDAKSEAPILAAARASMQPGKPAILFVTHILGGGAHRHVRELASGLRGKANTMVAAWGRGTWTVAVGTVPTGGGIGFRSPSQTGDLARFLRQAGVVRADIHHAMGFEPETEALLSELGIPFDFTLVDYHTVADDPHLCLPGGVFAGDDWLRPSGMLRRNPSPLLFRAERVFAISRDVAARHSRILPEVPVIAAAHWTERSSMRVRHVFPPRIWDGEPLRVLVAGWIADNKGKHVVLRAAQAAAERGLPLRFHVLGRMDLNEKEKTAAGECLTVYGPFTADRIERMLGRIAPHVGWLPAQAPETWSYVLTEYFEAALPVAASAIGAIPERCEGRRFTWLLPWDSPSEEWVRLFLQLHATGLNLPAQTPAPADLPAAEEVYFDEYLRPLPVQYTG